MISALLSYVFLRLLQLEMLGWIDCYCYPAL